MVITMDIEQQANYYAVIPAPVRYNKKLKYPERLLYGEITALSNRYGYCFGLWKCHIYSFHSCICIYIVD